MGVHYDAIMIGTGQAGPLLAGRLTATGMSADIVQRVPEADPRRHYHRTRAGLQDNDARKVSDRIPMTRVSRAIEKGETLGLMKVLINADTQRIIGAAILGTGGDEAIHSILDVMYADRPYTVIQKAMHIHPTVSELIPTILGELQPLSLPMLVAPDKTDKLLDRLDQARIQTDRLFEIVRADSLYDRPIPERHRIIFYIGHLEAFDWNLLQPGKSFDQSLDRLFAFGIDPVDGALPSDRPSDWPAIEQVRPYVSGVRERLDAVLQVAPEILLNTAIEHRLMHAETLTYMLHQLPLEKKIRQAQVEVPQRVQPLPELIEIPEGRVLLGLSCDHDDFGWDNEYEAHTVSVPAFAIDRYKITNGQYLDFMRAGGYENRTLWSSADWDWKTVQAVAHPAFWKESGDCWNLRTMFDEIPLPLSWPVYVSHAEAAAYARWAGKRLPAEAEWQRAAGDSPFPWGNEIPGPQHGYFDFARWDPAPVDAFPRARTAFGLDGLLANGWEWTASPFEPYGGFKASPFYEGYSANFFDGKHFVMKGGSPRTDRSMLRRSFRNWFQPHYPYVYAGFRCASDGGLK